MNTSKRTRRLAWSALCCLGLGLLGCPDPPAPEWTTDSPEALQEFEQGLAAEMKMYGVDARQHFERALEADPDFVMAQVKILARTYHRDPRYAELREHLEAADLDQLTPREAFLTRFFLLHRDRQVDEAIQLLDQYLVDHPKDPYGLELQCQGVWETGQWEAAERCYEHLLTVDPNWVLAQNRLGYLAMAQGHFEEAEERFRNYRYVAPDQANPHDSLGELFVLQGRYEEAERELREALEVRPDFCASYLNLATANLYQGQIEEAYDVADQSKENGCSPGYRARLRCQIGTFVLYQEEKWQELVEAVEGECYRSKLIATWLPHLGALHLGDLELARRLEDSEPIAAAGEMRMKQEYSESADLLSLKGTRLLAEGQPESAVEELREADDLLDYWGLGAGMYKVYNRLLLVEALRRSGETAAADQLLSEVGSVNPAMAAIYQDGDLSIP